MKAFFSYSHVDEVLRESLERHLTPLKREADLDLWYDRKMTAGSDLNSVISENLLRADIVLFLISSDFLHSHYCYNIEFLSTLERHLRNEVRIIPIIGRTCDWQSTPISKLLVTPQDGKPIDLWPNFDAACFDVIKQVRMVINELKLPKKTMVALPKALTSVVSEPFRLPMPVTEFDRRVSLHKAFQDCQNYFRSNIELVESQNTNCKTMYRELSSTTFSVATYFGGSEKASCKLRLDDSRVVFSYDSQAADNVFNESVTVKSDKTGIYFEPLVARALSEQRLAQEEVPEYFWSLYWTTVIR
ncbi:MAG: hypothetical protein QG574_4718 [Cyanobacteriota bacterium erpe_2018_sw_21hr_WHONDRS-SW48-000092_B_bin.40]|jgi:hypothetical protein|nr:hypothetical protein [Cyanobacteriota bacterium erpe_2018_sw_21hr_WHONDRS-SW48-000092_B_bin.40]